MSNTYIKKENIKKELLDKSFYPAIVKTVIENTETDVVEVVRCKDCKHYHLMEDGFFDCINPYGIDFPQQIDFCSYGEIK